MDFHYRAVPAGYYSDGSQRRRIAASFLKESRVKTNAVRILDGLKIAYELREYEVDPDDLAAESVAGKIGLPAEQVFKTLVARGDRNGVAMAVVPGNYELDLKALATATGDRRSISCL